MHVINTIKYEFILLSFLATLFISPIWQTFAHAQYGGGTGEPNDPYQITSAANLVALGEDPNNYDKHFILTADIDLDPNLPGCKVFDKAVIGSITNSASDIQRIAFIGSFDGNGYTISHLTIKDGVSYLGLFSEIGPLGRIHNLRMDDIHVSSSGYYISGLVGYNRGIITNCYISGSISGGSDTSCSYLSLLVGRNRGNIINCHVNGHVSSGSTERGHYLGLLAGYNLGEISHCDAYGSVTAGKLFWQIGGLVGENLDSITDCVSSCIVTINSIYEGTGYVGGLVGSNRGLINRCYANDDVFLGKYIDDAGGLVGYNSGRIIGCYACGNVSGTQGNWRLGGLVGWNYGYILHCFARGNVTGDGDIGGLIGNDRGTISHAYATGRVVGAKLSYYDAGGLVGDGYRNNVSSCFWDIETCGRITSEGGEGLSTVQMQDQLTFLNAGWDFTGERANGTGDVWQMPEGGGYPELTFFSNGYQRQELEGNGTCDNPYLVATSEDLGAILHNNCKACYRLVADVNLADITWSTAVIPSFEGTFDGNSHIISNLTIHGGDYLGLFGEIGKDAMVENLIIKDANIVGDSSASDLGILAVENWGYIANCQVSGSVSGGQYEEHLGGIVKYNLGTIINCDPVDYDGPYSVIISDPVATRQFLIFEGIDFDQIWIPEGTDLEDLDSILKTCLTSEKPIQTSTWLDSEYILDNFSRYDREYSGFILNDSKYIICQMILWSGFQGSCFIAEYEPGIKFTIIFDGGCGVVRVIFNVESNTVVSISCNGIA
jgi:hypothetical protein